MIIYRIFRTHIKQDNDNRTWEQVGPDYKDVARAIANYVKLVGEEDNPGYLYKMQQHYSISASHV